ncbi:MAG: hypothetical protein QGF59_31235, partial [Pirellulaceae bacterium]|nr:hypothetical protein [Pirellulaceae bacterium]
DFSMQIEVGDRSKLLGRVFLSNDRRGRYLSHRIEKRPAGIPTDVQRILNDAATRKTLNSAWRTVAERLLALGHRGAAGIDAMIYRSQSGELQLRPIVEVNPRYTFGRIALELRNTHTSDEPALMTVLREADLRAARVNTMEELLQRLASEGQDVLALTPVGPTSKWAMVRMIGPVSPGTLAALIESRVTNDAFLVQRSSEAQ